MYENKIIGIWGLGKVGTAEDNFFSRKNAQVIGMDSRNKNEFIIKFSHLVSEEKKDQFFDQADYILTSPGIDIRPYYQHYKQKWITELDVFGAHWHKPIIAITGSVGKTTVTHLLNQLLSHYAARIALGGNIGTPMLDLLDQDKDTALLEVSSFQLEYSTSFAPDLAVWTNFVPNHLDRHTLDEYFHAKTQIFAHQTAAQKALVPLSIARKVNNKYPRRKFLIMIDEAITECEKKALTQQGHVLFCIENEVVYKYTQSGKAALLAIDSLPDTTFTCNWLTICATLHSLGYDVTLIPTFAATAQIPEHRMEKIVREAITFYNDSKATTPTSTLSAIERLKGQKIILFLGGLSKGIDRSTLVQSLQGTVQRIYCFGKEAPVLHQWCNDYSIPSSSHPTLETAFSSCMENRKENEIIVLSPSGSSYDLFKDYEERGNRFKNLIENYFESKKSI